MTVLDTDFDFIRELVRRESGISLSSEKQYLVKSRLAPLLTQNGIANLRALVQQLRAKPNDPLRKELIELMTTNESWFFRDHWPFECLRSFIFPSVVERKGSDRTINIWSAACSTGQEPYSLAIACREAFDTLAGWNIKIVATDLSQAVLDRARKGVFTQTEISRGLSPAQKGRYFTQANGNWVIRDEIRSMIDFQPLNLSKPWPRLPQFDIVFLRNVLIYFDVETKEAVLKRITQNMNPSSYLFLGSGETLVNIKTNLESEPWNSNLLYRTPREKRSTFAPPVEVPATATSFSTLRK